MYDSGAQESFVNDPKLLVGAIECRQPFLAANDSMGMATQIGDLALRGQGLTINLKRVLYSPDLDYNIVSTWQVASAGYKVSHDDEKLWITPREGGKDIIIATTPGDHLFYGTMELEPVTKDQVDFGSRFQLDPDKWLQAQQYALIANVRMPELPKPLWTQRHNLLPPRMRTRIT